MDTTSCSLDSKMILKFTTEVKPLFSDYISGGYGGPPQQGYGAPQGQYGQGVYQPPASQNQFPGQQFLQDPMANMAMQYGETIANQGKDYVHKNVSEKKINLDYFIGRNYS